MLKEIWTRGTAEFHGLFVDFAPIHSWPKPVQRPHPPVSVGGNSKAALRRVCSLDGRLPDAPLTVDRIPRAREWLAANGRTYVPIVIGGFGHERQTGADYVDACVDEVTFLR